MTEILATTEPAPPELRGSALADSAIALVRGSVSKLWPLWLLASVMGGAALVLGHATEVLGKHSHSSIWPQRLGYDLFVALGPVIPWGMATRAFLTDGSWWRVDRPLLECLGLVAGSQLFTLLIGGLSEVIRGGIGPPLSLFLIFGSLAIMIALIWIWARLSLWPTGRLLGDRDMTARRSWRLMRGAVGPFILAAILVCALPAIVGTVLYAPYRHNGALWHVVAAAPFQGLANLLSAGLSATLYRLRTGIETPAHVTPTSTA
jgi:hypothetical protein